MTLETEVQTEELEKVAGGVAGEIGLKLVSYLYNYVYPNKFGLTVLLKT